LRIQGIIIGGARVSYPFSDHSAPDPHVYSSYLSFTFVAYYEYIRKVLNHGSVRSYVICVLSVLALFMTGSKTGILILFIYFMIIMLRFLKYLRKKDIKVLIVLIIFGVFVGAMLNMYRNYYGHLQTHEVSSNFLIPALAMRTLNYDISNPSINSRIKSFVGVINEIDNKYLLIGSGPTSAFSTWYDGALSIILAHGGLLGFTSLLILGFIIIKRKRLVLNNKSKELYKSFIILLFIYLLENIISEHFLLTRNILPVATLLSVIYVNIKQSSRYNLYNTINNRY